jgi:hypothetical protein
MTLADTVLEKLASLSPAAAVRRTLSFADADTSTSVRLEVERLEALGCQLWEVGVTRSAGSPPCEGGVGGVAAWAKRVAEAVTGLMEPLKVLEVDLVHGQAVLRSETPTQRGDECFYYEVVLSQAGIATLRRYRGAKLPAKREQVSFVLTREALGKVVQDLAA